MILSQSWVRRIRSSEGSTQYRTRPTTYAAAARSSDPSTSTTAQKSTPAKPVGKQKGTTHQKGNPKPPGATPPGGAKGTERSDKRQRPRARSRRRGRPTFTVLVTSPDQEQPDADRVKQQLLTTVNPVSGGIRIKNVRKTQNGKVVVEAHSRENMERLISHPELEKHGLRTETMPPREPRLIIHDIPADMEDADLKEAIWSQNPSLKESMSQAELTQELSLKFRLGRREEPNTKWVVAVTPRLRQKILQSRRLYIGCQRCRAVDFTSVTRCYRCLGLGHVAKHCKAPKDTCSHCGESHRKADCANGHLPPCKIRGRPHYHSGDAKDCPTYKRLAERILQSTDYGA